MKELTLFFRLFVFLILYFLLSISFINENSAFATDHGGGTDSPKFDIDNPITIHFKEMNKKVFQENERGIKAWKNEDYQEALNHFSIVATSFPSIGEPYFNKALCLHMLGQHIDATHNFKEAIRNAQGNKIILNSETLRAHLE